MTRFSFPLLLSLLAGSGVNAFVVRPARQLVPTWSTAQPLFASIGNDQNTNMSRAINDNKKKVNENLDQASFEFQDLVDKIQNTDLDWDRLSDGIEGIKKNAVDGEFGQRGEIYFIAQLICLGAILTGNIPLIGGTVLFLLGPGLLLSGVIGVTLSLMEMGTALSPWPAPPANEPLITSGLYTQCRHPMYAGLLAASAGLAVMSDSVPRLLLTLVLYLIFQAKTNVEEEGLAQVHAIEYSAYKNEVTSKFVPKAVMNLLERN